MAAVSARTTALCTCLALLAFAANSLLCRAALGARSIDAASFTSVRLVSGAIALVLLARAGGMRPQGGGWAPAAALFVYAIGFSFAYLRIQTGVGALILFGCVQATMILGALLRGDRLGAAQWIGLALALAGLAWLTLPGAQAPDPLGAALMALAGLAWGLYSLYGRGNANPLASTARNFVLTLPFALAASALTWGNWQASTRGLVLAATSGALTSGVGYTIWYTALRSLSASTAGTAQLAVPVIAATGGVLLLGETQSSRLVVSAALVLGGIALALRRPRG